MVHHRWNTATRHCIELIERLTERNANISGSFPFTVRVADSAQQAATKRPLHSGDAALQITTVSVPTAPVSAAYATTLTATGAIARLSGRFRQERFPLG